MCVVPTTILVAQQAAVFRRHVSVGVSEFTGARKVEPWTKERWRDEVSCATKPVLFDNLANNDHPCPLHKHCRQNGVFVLTPAICVEAMRKGFLALTDVSILVFDEAHHCRKRHPYAQIMHYYWKIPDPADRPRVFGMTASPVNFKLSDKSDSARDAIVASVRQLEANLNARVVTISDLTEIQAVWTHVGSDLHSNSHLCRAPWS